MNRMIVAHVSRRLAVIALVFGTAAVAACLPSESKSPSPQDSLPQITVYKSPTCGCCTKWVDHMRENGFEVETKDMSDVRPMKDRLGVPQDLSACHTGFVDGYVVEGHVPADVVKQFLEEEPDVLGLAVPGMPMGSPGMEGSYSESYEVLTFDGQGGRDVFARR